MSQNALTGEHVGNFRFDRFLGGSGIAQVYQAWDIHLDRPVAVKVIPARSPEQRTYVESFLHQARAVATWQHENIVRIYFADEEAGLCYLVMEYVEGMDLGELVAQYAGAGELMPHDDVLRLGRAIAAALDYAHGRGMVHGNVKPTNVLIAVDGHVVLTDFAGDVPQSILAQLPGSAPYIAPEQARGPAGPQSDLYALGVILYELLTGTVPFDDPSSTQAPPSPRTVNPNLNWETEAVLLKAVSEEPAERYQTGRELLDDLAAALQAPESAIMDLPPLPAPPGAPPIRSLSPISVGERVAMHMAVCPPPAADQAAAPGQADLIGQRLDEYLLEELLGHGGMGRVYRGRDVRLDRRVAIKVIDPPFRADANYLKRFEREAQAVARLEHPNVVRLYHYGRGKGVLYIAMQYVDGTDLATLLARHREAGERLPPEEARRLVRQVGQALDYVHSQGIIHRDVKPANIIIDQQDQAILTDFGLALLTETGTRGTVIGSPHYLAPEQALSSARAVPQSDLYALGVILYEMFSGERPFEADDLLQIAIKHLREPPRAPRELCPGISPAVEAVILKALAKEPQDRYPTGAALADALDAALDAAPAAADVPLPEEAPVRAGPPPSAPAREKPRRAPRPRPADKFPYPKVTRWPRLRLPSKRFILYAGIVLAVELILAAIMVGVLLGSQAGQHAATPGTTPIAGVITPRADSSPVPASPLPSAAPPATEAPVVDSPAPATHEPTLAPPTTSAPPTSVPTLAPSPTPIPPGPAPYKLLIQKKGKEWLLVINEAAEPFSLARLRMGSEKGEIRGSDWGLEVLESDTCILAWKKDGDTPPAIKECHVQASLEVDAAFWEKRFAVYIDGQEVGTCAKNRCRFEGTIAFVTFYLTRSFCQGFASWG